MGRIIDLTGQKFGRLTVIGLSNKKSTSGSVWDCVCECGSSISVSACNLKSGTQSCGCIQCPNIVGQKFGRLTVIERVYSEKEKGAHWLCHCDCGGSVIVNYGIRKGAPRSCGCLTREELAKKKTIHGKSRTPEYTIWRNMISRCTDPKNNRYAIYGGRGIKVCARWLTSIDNFLGDMGKRPDAHSIDRIAVDGDYCPENCRWATPVEQANNLRINHRIVIGSASITLAEASRLTGIQSSTLRWRLANNWPIQKVLNCTSEGQWLDLERKLFSQQAPEKVKMVTP